jgi:hypothetical protein
VVGGAHRAGGQVGVSVAICMLSGVYREKKTQHTTDKKHALLFLQLGKKIEA